MARASLICTALGWLVAIPALAADERPPPLHENPFKLVKDIVVPGTTFRVEVAAAGPDAAAAFDPGEDRVDFRIQYRGSASPRGVPLRVFARTVDGKTFLEMRMPGLDELEGIRTQGGGNGPLHPYDATLVANLSRGLETYDVPFPLHLPDVTWAATWGVVAVLVALALVAILASTDRDARARGGSVGSYLLAPLQLVTTPVGGYSLSQAQILFWSCITIFGLVYVYFLTFSFLAITPQILVLLGISGGTAVASRTLAQDGMVAKAMALAGYPKRSPRLRDLIWSVGGADVFKFQMLTFTILTGYIVVVEIAKTYAFPDIPENLVALMGVSSTVYVGNKIVQKSDTADARATLRQKLGEIGDRLSDHAAKGAVQRGELTRLIEEIYPPSDGAARPPGAGAAGG